MAKTHCLFGLSANPPHLNHLFIATYLTDRFDTVTIVPCFKHAFNKNLIEFNHRYNMCQLAFKNFHVSRVEEILGGKSITARTVEYLKNFEPVSDFYFAVGKDAFKDFDKWEAKVKLLSMAKPFVVDEVDIFPGFHSTQIRNDIKDGYPEVAQKYLPKKVFEYIMENKLYK
jgi:nicotinate-nucleotide adenylyltransferase